MRKTRTNLRELESDLIAELIEVHGIEGAAQVLDCSRTGLTYQIERRGIEKPDPKCARTREKLRQAALHRYGYGNADDLVVLIRQLGQELGRRPRIKDLVGRDGFPSRDTFASRFGSWTKALEAAGYEKPKSKPGPQKREKRKRKPAKEKYKPPPLTERIYKSITPKLRFAILERDGFRCRYCGRSPREHGVTLHIDHVTPVSKDGLTTYKNLVSCCVECNLGKGNSHIRAIAVSSRPGRSA